MTDFIAEYADYLQHERRAATTIESYVRILRRMDRQIPAGLLAATGSELYDWIFAGKRGDVTHEHYINIALGFGRWAVEREGEHLDYNAAAELPKLRAEASRKVRPATEAEYADILARAAMPYLDLYVLAGFQGMRCIEISRACREHIDRQEMRVFGKGSKWRTVPTHPVVWDRFGGRGPGPLACDRAGKPLTREQVIGWGNKHLQRTLGYKHLSMHCFRKRYGTQVYVLSGNDIRVAQELLGHAFVSTTQVYVEASKDRQAAAVAALPVPEGARRRAS